MFFVVDLRFKIEGFEARSFKEFNISREKLESVINNWIFRKRMEFGYREIEIISVLVNGEEDLTEVFKRQRDLN